MICKKCGKEKAPDQYYEVQHKYFPPYNGDPVIYVHRRTTCIACMSIYTKAMYLKRKMNVKKTAP